MDDTHKLAWLAGLIDGEGSFGIYGKNLMLRINLAEKDKFVLEEVQKIAGGTLRYNTRLNERNPNWSNQWCWGLWRRKELYLFCKRILPYLLLKKESCQKLLKAYEDNLQNKYGVVLH